MFNFIQPFDLNKLVQLAYYTDARNRKIQSISRDNVLDGSIHFGKTGRRHVKLNSQEQKLINRQDTLLKSKRDYITKTTE